MESLETAALFIDNLLDFNLDIVELNDEDDDDKKNQSLNDQNQNNSAELPPISDSVPPHDSFPALVEEELEWLSNQDAFPPIETFDILPLKPEKYEKHEKYENHETVLKNQSPISVLGNSYSSVRVPVKARSKRRRRRRTSYSDLSGKQWWFCYEPKKKSVVGPRTPTTTTLIRRCLHCQADKTPQWRAGPLGPKTLCNACGVRYKSGRLVPEYRPASSPTFSEEMHSNSHRKIMDMRRQRQDEQFMEFPNKGYESKKKILGATRMSTTTFNVRRCQHCQANKTPEWREGPLGPRILCNACGVRYRSGRLLPECRPANSPTISGELHSNSHRKVLDMQSQEQKELLLQSPGKGGSYQVVQISRN